MNIKTMIEWLKELPDDYEMCFSEYTSIVIGPDDFTEVADSTSEYFVVLDCPIVGIVVNKENKEVRFYTKTSEERVLNEIEKGKIWRQLE